MWQPSQSLATKARSKSTRHAWQGLGLNRKSNAQTVFQHCLAMRFRREKPDRVRESMIGGWGIGRSCLCGRRGY